MKRIKEYLLIIGCLLGFQMHLKANMASPQFELLSGVSTISSRQIDILHEDLKISFDPFFDNAFFNVHYRIRADKSGKQIPLLFVAELYKSNFTVEVDGKSVEVLRIPETFYTSGRLKDYSPPNIEVEPDEVFVNWPVFQKVYQKKDVQYFEVNLSKGEHSIIVRYESNSLTDQENNIDTKKSFKYLLSPAKLWKSFGGLSLTIDGTDFLKNNPRAYISSDFGDLTPSEPVKSWEFDSIPADYFYINYYPEVPMNIQPYIDYYKPAIIIYGGGLLLLLIIAYVIYRYKKKQKS